MTKGVALGTHQEPFEKGSWNSKTSVKAKLLCNLAEVMLYDK